MLAKEILDLMCIALWKAYSFKGVNIDAMVHLDVSNQQAEKWLACIIRKILCSSQQVSFWWYWRIFGSSCQSTLDRFRAINVNSKSECLAIPVSQGPSTPRFGTCCETANRCPLDNTSPVWSSWCYAFLLQGLQRGQGRSKSKEPTCLSQDWSRRHYGCDIWRLASARSSGPLVSRKILPASRLRTTADTENNATPTA